MAGCPINTFGFQQKAILGEIGIPEKKQEEKKKKKKIRDGCERICKTKEHKTFFKIAFKAVEKEYLQRFKFLKALFLRISFCLTFIQQFICVETGTKKKGKGK